MKLIILTMLSYLLQSFRLPTRKFSISQYDYKQSAKLSVSTKPSLEILTRPQSSGITQYVFVGGKGGVGKTSTSSAIALGLSDSGLRTLIVSTDPAHSLGDALDVNLSSGNIVKLTTEAKLWAMEIDVERALDDFRDNAKDFDAKSLSKTFGIPQDILESLGLDDMASIFTNPPPGIDEIVALIQIFQSSEALNDRGEPRFQRVVIDTAPTGHTLRLLQLPQFLTSVTGKLLLLQSKISSAVASFKSLFGGSAQEEQPQSNPLDKLEKLQTNLARVQGVLRDPERTQFVVVSIPTVLAVEESQRLLQSLKSERVGVSTVVCNQIVTDQMGLKYLITRSNGQKNVIKRLQTTANTTIPNIEIVEVPYVDTEVTGLFGLRFFATLAHPAKAKTASNPIDSKKLSIFGGKGGVGKTTTSASWAVQLCQAGFRTLVVSTDPAHSLGDSLQEQLSGQPRQLDTSYLGGDSGGELWALEIDPKEALQEFRDAVTETADATTQSNSDTASGKGFMASMGLPDFKAELSDIVSGVKDPPPGTDEVVALTKVISYLTKGYTLPNGRTVKFDRVVLDTAPTGHTLRMLNLPPFLIQLVEKLKSIRSKASGGILGAMSGMTSSTESERNVPEGEDKLSRFEKSMRRLDAMIHNERECEFVVVTIPTDVATAESSRLLSSLANEGISVRRLVINQVLPKHDDSNALADAYLTKLRQGQSKSISTLKKLCEIDGINLIEVPYFDTEVRTVYGLRVISSLLFPKPTNA